MTTDGTNAIPASMSVLAELDQTQAELQNEFPGWRIWYVYRADTVSWGARREPVLNTQTAGDLREAILGVLSREDGDESVMLEVTRVPFVSHQQDYVDPEDTLDPLSVIIDESIEGAQ